MRLLAAELNTLSQSFNESLVAFESIVYPQNIVKAFVDFIAFLLVYLLPYFALLGVTLFSF